jgi:hypothetical protein
MHAYKHSAMLMQTKRLQQVIEQIDRHTVLLGITYHIMGRSDVMHVL